MGLIFHNGHHEVFWKYVQNRPWNDPDFVGNGGKFSKYNKPEEIKRILTHHRSRTGGDPTQPGGGEENFKGVILADGVNIYVLKGIHQFGGGFVPVPHITIGYNGYLYHLNLMDDADAGLLVVDFSKGDKAQDADGFTEPKTKRKRR